jgi:hypothetical protein
VGWARFSTAVLSLGGLLFPLALHERLWLRGKGSSAQSRCQMRQRRMIDSESSV